MREGVGGSPASNFALPGIRASALACLLAGAATALLDQVKQAQQVGLSAMGYNP